MVQYCRYCSHLCTVNGIWCSAKQRELAESTAKSTNHCKLFSFNPVDAFYETGDYKPREKKQKNCEGQITLKVGAK